MYDKGKCFPLLVQWVKLPLNLFLKLFSYCSEHCSHFNSVHYVSHTSMIVLGRERKTFQRLFLQEYHSFFRILKILNIDFNIQYVNAIIKAFCVFLKNTLYNLCFQNPYKHIWKFHNNKQILFTLSLDKGKHTNKTLPIFVVVF